MIAWLMLYNTESSQSFFYQKAVAAIVKCGWKCELIQNEMQISSGWIGGTRYNPEILVAEIWRDANDCNC